MHAWVAMKNQYILNGTGFVLAGNPQLVGVLPLRSGVDKQGLSFPESDLVIGCEGGVIERFLPSLLGPENFKSRFR